MIRETADKPTQAGWYHYQGDPPGTVRRWTGLEWIGSPIREPSAEDLAAAGIAPSSGAAPAAAAFTPMARRSRLSPGSTALSVNTMALLGSMGVLFSVAAYRIWSRSDEVRASNGSRSTDGTRGVGDLVGYIPGLTQLMVAIGGLMLVTAVFFIAWLRRVAVVAQISKFARGSRKPANRSGTRLFFQWFFFGAFAIVWWILSWALSGIAAAAGGNRGMFGIVNDTAMVASVDPRTGLSRIEPIKVMAWWGLWWGPLIVSTAGIAWLWIAGMSASTFHSFVRLHTVLLAFEALSLTLIVITMGQITYYLRR